LLISAILQLSLLAVMPSVPLPSPIEHERDPGVPTERQDGHDVSDALQSLGGYFIENRGQVLDGIRYYSTGNPSVAFGDDAVIFVVRAVDSGDHRDILPEQIDRSSGTYKTTTVETVAYMLRFEGANKVMPIGIDRLPFSSNFFIGNNPHKWKTIVPNYGEVVYRNLYNGIDLVYRQNAKGIKYEFIVGPGANLRAMRMNYEGIDSLRLEDGEMVIQSAAGDVRDILPYAFEGKGERIECRFILYGPVSYGFDCDGRDVSKQLVIDPLVYSTFLGGGGEDRGWSIAVDSSGNAYATGLTLSVDFPAKPGSFDTSYNGSGRDAFVAKLDPAGSNLMYCTYLGGSLDEDFSAIAIDSLGSAYLTGSTQSSDFPTTAGAFDTVFNGGYDSYVTKLNGTGSGLVYSTFLGGRDFDAGRAIALDSAGNAYVAGDTNSTDFPVTAGAFSPTLRGSDNAFITELDSLGRTLVYSTYLGSTSRDYALSIALDSGGDAYVVGQTDSPDFPTTSAAFDTSYNGGPPASPYDVFVTKLNATGTGLVYSTFLGGDGTDFGYSVKVDSMGNAYVTGGTSSINFPITSGSYSTSLSGTRDAFVSELNAAGSSLVYSTYLGGGGYDLATSLALNSVNEAYVTGVTFSANFPVTPDAADGFYNGFEDVFVAGLNFTGSKLVYSTFLGGLDNENTGSIAMDTADCAYIMGETYSVDFPTTPGALSTTYRGNGDTFVTKIRTPTLVDLPDLTISPSDISFAPPGPAVVGSSVLIDVTVHNIGSANASQVAARFYDGTPPSSPIIGTDQTIPFLQRLGGAGTASVTWLAGNLGVHEICIVADPESSIAELDESNNQACAPIEVVAPPMPDLTLASSDILLSPSPPYAESVLVKVNATVHNIGTNVSSTTVARFYDGMPPSLQIGTDQPLPPIPVSGSANVSVTWTASPLGSHDICVFADPDNLVTEIDETNNVACIDVLVQPGPILRPDYVPISPLPLPPIRVGMSSQVSLSSQVLNQGNGTATDNAIVAFYEQSSPPFSTFVLSPLAPATVSSRFTAIWTSPAIPGTYSVSVDVDYDNNVSEWDETNNVYTWMIEVVSGPLTSLVIGSPNYTSPAMITYVKSSTPLSLFVLDQSGLGIRNTTYRIDGGSPVNYTATGPFFLAGEGVHTVEWRSLDWAGNLEDVNSIELTVDDTPPATAIAIGEPKYLTGGSYVKSTTPLALSATDGGVGSNSTFYRLWDGTWSQWRDYSASFTLAGRDGTWYVEYLSYDYLGNMEVVRNETLILDNTPPVTTISPVAPFTLTAVDSGCGVNVTMYRIDGGSWTVYTDGFTLTEGEHTIYYYSIDNLGNVEQEKSLTIKPTIEVAVNYKPIIALIFAIILLVTGVWSSKRRPWKGGKGRMALAKAFMFTSMPFVLAEAATGVVSLLTGLLSIPPVIELGMLVDAAILVAGVGVAIMRLIESKPGSSR
jgi:subtilase family serine protease